VQGSQHLCLAGSHDVYWAFTSVSHTIRLSLPTALMLAVATSPHGVAAMLLHEASWSRGFLSRESTSGRTLGCVMTIQAQQTRRRPRVAAPSEPDLILLASSGSPVSLSLQRWPIEMDVIVAAFAERYTLAFTGYHDLHP